MMVPRAMNNKEVKKITKMIKDRNMTHERKGERVSYLASRLKVIFIIVFKYLYSIYPHYGIPHSGLHLEKS